MRIFSSEMKKTKNLGDFTTWLFNYLLLLSHRWHLYYERIYKQGEELVPRFPLDDLTILLQMWSSSWVVFYDHIAGQEFLDIFCGKISHNHGIHNLKEEK